MESIAFHPTNEDIVRIMIDLSKGDKSVSVLDTGYGKGAFLDGLIKLKYKNITGIEYSKDFYDMSKDDDKYKDITKINEDYLKYSKKYELIIGNPPYIKSSKLETEMKSRLKELTTNNSSDIYYGFIINSIKNLKEDGELIYLLPKTFFTNKYATYLRNYMLENGYFEYIIDFGELPIFESANVETIIFKYKKTKNIDDKIKIITSVNRKGSGTYISSLEKIIENEEDNNDFIFFEKEQYEKDSFWNISKDIKKIRGVKLSELVNIGVGIVSGCDDVFKIDKDILKRFNKKEKDFFIFDFLKAKNLESYLSKGELTKMLFIPSKMSSIDMFEDFKNIKEYLIENKAILEDRYFTNDKKPFFYWLAIRNMEKIEENMNKKILSVPSFSRKESEWFSMSFDKNRLISSDILFLSQKGETDLYFILGYLNSDFFAKYYDSIGIKKGARFIFTQGYLSNITIPIFTEKEKEDISKITREIIKNKENKKDVYNEREKIEEIIIESLNK